MAREKSLKLNRKVLDHYINNLAREINIDGVLLFGSYAYGGADKHSDIDLAVISPDFKGKGFWERVAWLSHMRDKPTYLLAMDIFGYTPEEFLNIENKSATMAKAKKDGIWLQKLNNV